MIALKTQLDANISAEGRVTPSLKGNAHIVKPI